MSNTQIITEQPPSGSSVVTYSIYGGVQYRSPLDLRLLPVVIYSDANNPERESSGETTND